MASLNRVMFIGNLGRNPEIKTTPGGALVASFSIACTENWTDQQGQRQERTEWVNLVAWRKSAEIAQRYLKKGSRIYVEGRLQTRSWDGQDGKRQYRTEVQVDRFVMLDGRQGERQGGDNTVPFPGGDGGWDEARNLAGQRSSEQGFGAPPADEDRDLPF